MPNDACSATLSRSNALTITRLAATFSKVPLIGRVIPLILDRAWPGARTSGVARTRFIDDRLKQALRDGYQQVVILGAGFDSRAYRMEELSGVRVIEVDHPATSRQKRSILERTPAILPSGIQFLEIDFNKQSLEEGFRRVDCASSLPMVVIWEGVTNYLTADGVEATFRSLGRIAKRCRIIFTYVDKAVLDPNAAFDGAANAKARISSVGENWTFGFDSKELSTYLARHQFRLLEDIGSREYRMLYMPSRRGLLRGYEWYRIAVAESGTVT